MLAVLLCTCVACVLTGLAALQVQKALALASDRIRRAVRLPLSDTGMHSPDPQVAAVNSTQADHQAIQDRHASDVQLLGAASPDNEPKVRHVACHPVRHDLVVLTGLWYPKIASEGTRASVMSSLVLFVCLSLRQCAKPSCCSRRREPQPLQPDSQCRILMLVLLCLAHLVLP